MTKKITLGAKTKKAITCSNCGNSIPAGEQFTFRAKDGSDLNVCSDCKVQIDHALEQETKNVPYRKAILGGFAGAFLGGLLWFLIEFFTGFQIGYVAIGVGFLVVKGISMGSENRRSNALQIIGLILTLLAIVAAQYSMGVYYIQQEVLKQYPNEPMEVVIIGSLYGAAIEFVNYAISPIGLFIWGIALYYVYWGLKPAKI